MKRIISLMTAAALLAVALSLPITANAGSVYDSLIVSKGDTLLYNLPNGGIDYPYERSYYKTNDGDALFVTCYTQNTEDSTGYNWYNCLLVSKDIEASLYYTTPTNWMWGYGSTNSIEFKGETWYYTSGAGMHVYEADEPTNVFNLNAATGAPAYNSIKDATIALLEYCFGEEAPEYAKGDINGDGNINSRDIVALRRFIAGGYDVEAVGNADITDDGSINSRDVVALRRQIAG